MLAYSGLRAAKANISRHSLGSAIRYDMIVGLRYKSQTTDMASSESPHNYAKQSSMPNLVNPEIPKKDVNPKQILEKPLYERAVVRLPEWQKALGEAIVSIFHMDMDRIRAGSIGGSKYYYMCKDQSLQYKNEVLSETAAFWYSTLGLPRTFAQWYQITILHIWMLFVRMRALPFKVGKNYQQKLVDKFFKDIDMRLSEEMDIRSGTIRTRYLKDFHSQMIGIVASLDEALASQSDAVLASAIWRNVFNGDKNIDIVKLEAVIRYVRMQLYVLDKISDRAFGFGDFEFVSPAETVDPLTPEEVQQLRKVTKEKYESIDGKILPSQHSSLSLDE